MTTTRRRRCTAGLAAVVAAAVLATGPSIATAAPADQAVTAADVTFATQSGGTYDGMPLFDGVPAHLDAYLNTLVEYVGIEGAIYWAHGQRGDFTILSGPNAGKVVPGSSLFDEGVQGISTDMPAPIAIGQTWNPELAREVGEVIGNENLYGNDFLGSISTFNPMLSAPHQDIRFNPLSGRLDEGFGEDANFASLLTDATANGMSGIDEAENPEGFWTKNMLNTKHYTSYVSQWFRRTSDNPVSARALMEYQSRPGMNSIESGAISSMLTTFGRTNGIPNIISPLIAEAQNRAPWGGLYSVNDINGHRELTLPNAFSNGFETQYTPNQATATALLAIGNAAGIAVNEASGSPSNAALLQQLENGTYGVTVEDVETLAKSQVAPLVRVGLFNERDAAGYPVDYPFVSYSAASQVALNASNPDHQATALDAAQESIVLLKNEGDILPLADDVAPAVVGPLSDARFRTTRAIDAPGVENGGLTPVQGIEERAGAELPSATDGEVVALKSLANGQYLTQGAGATPLLTANGAAAADASTFEAFDWGQETVSLRSTSNNQWLRYATNQVNVGGTEAFGTSRTALPYRLRQIDNADGTVSFVVDNFSTGFGGGFETRFYTFGRYLTVDPTTNELGVTDVLRDPANARVLNTPATKFTVETVRATGSQAAELAAEDAADHAIVVVGTPPRHSSGEGADRSDLDIGDRQYELVESVASDFPGRTIVVISSTTPVAVEDIQNNPDVAAVIQLPDNGQFGNLALGQMIYGDFAPSGRTSSTWYTSIDALPDLDEYSIPTGQDNLIGLENLDPRFTVDMTNGDPQTTGLTYMYTDAPTTYEFGYGLSYTSFEYSNFRIATPTSPEAPYRASVRVTNTGSTDSDEVVQVYAHNPGSTYGDAAPKKQLVSFGKVSVPAGQSRDVTLEFDAEKLALWNTSTNALDVETGEYEFYVGRSSSDLRLTQIASVSGTDFAPTSLSAGAVNVFDRSFTHSDVVYREVSRATTVQGLKDDELVNGYYAVVSKREGSWTAINDVDLSGAESLTLRVGSQNPSSTIQLRVGSPTGALLGEATFGATGSTEYVIPGSNAAGNIPVTETAYADVTVDITPRAGLEDLYVVFGDKDIRIDTIGVGESAESPFSDVGVDNQFYKEISWLARADISTGWDNGDGTFSFRPLSPIARDAMAAFLYRAAESPAFTPPTVSPFTDVAVDNQFYTEIAWLADQEISTGWANGDGTYSFRPLEPIARDAMAAFLYRSADSPAFTAPATSPFEDLNPDVQFYKEITWMRHTGIATGWQGNDGRARYAPLESVARDAMAAFLHRYDEAGF